MHTIRKIRKIKGNDFLGIDAMELLMQLKITIGRMNNNVSFSNRLMANIVDTVSTSKMLAKDVKHITVAIKISGWTMLNYTNII